MTTPEPAVEITDALRDMLGDAADEVEQRYQTLFNWLVEKGANPRRERGLEESTAGNYIERLDQLHRFTIQYIAPDDPRIIEPDEADELLLRIDRGDITKQRGKHSGEEYVESTKRKFANALQSYFKWRYHDGSINYEWEPKLDFSDNKGESAYRFTYHELGLLFETAQSYGSLPSYYDSTDDQRESIDGLVAQRLGIPKEDVTRNDWLHADWSRKIHSMVSVGYDAGLTPAEVAEARTHWYDPQTQTFTIPSEHAAKEREKEQMGVSDESAEALSEWMQERRHLDKYDGTNRLWLNREGNPYMSGSLCKLIRNLCEEAGIETENRKVVWYSLRKSMGTNVTDEGALAEANDQLRHERLSTTQENYNQTPVEKLRARLNQTRKTAKKAAADPDYNPFEEETPSADTSSHRATAESSPSQQPAETNEVITPQPGGDIHVDVTISDTTEARADVAYRLLDTDADG